ncbi:hypothetical protein CALCODRAFT_481541 [Calocera cornea HHB12733]|uniref:Replication factor A C-terminal domain-containing protein n=1 Tax=Calocera cornea HHB12733 TaxID=1353952 RepID=A0A165HMC9_9BASI|nr:hypothetical protein CALCODRAFT_481541 [Calocera cornea HHB12733]
MPPALDGGVLEALLAADLAPGEPNTRVQLINLYEEADDEGEPLDPPFWHLTLSDGLLQVANIVAGPELIARLRTGALRLYDVVDIVAAERWVTNFGDGLSIIVYEVDRIQGFNGFIGRPDPPPHWERINCPYDGYLRSLNWIAAPNEAVDSQPSSQGSAPPAVDHALAPGLQAAQPGGTGPQQPLRPPQPEQAAQPGGAPGHAPPHGAVTIVGVGDVPDHLIAQSQPVVPRPPEPRAYVVDQDFPMNEPLDAEAVQHYAENPGLLPGAAAQPDPLPWQMPGWGPPPKITPIQEVVAYNRNVYVIGRVSRITPRNKTVDLVLHDAGSEIDLVVKQCKDPKMSAFERAEGIQVGKVYCVTNLNVVASVQHWCRSYHPAQLVFVAPEAEFLEVPDDGTIPRMHLNLRKIAQLPSIPDRKPVDVACIIVNTSNVMYGRAPHEASFDHAQPASTTRMDMWVADEGGHVGHFIAFDQFWRRLEGSDGRVALLKNVLVDKSRGLSIRTDAAHTQILWDDEVPNHAELLAWWDFAKDDPAQWHVLSAACSADGARSLRTRSLLTVPPLKTIAEVYREKLDEDLRTGTFRIEGTIEFDEAKSVTYQGCATPNCNRKVDLGDVAADHFYHCPLCGQAFFFPVPKYCLQFSLIDRNGQRAHVTAFNTAAESLLGISAEHMHELYQDEARFKPVHALNLQSAMTGRYIVTIQGTRKAVGYFRLRRSWIATEFFKVGRVYDDAPEV